MRPFLVGYRELCEFVARAFSCCGLTPENARSAAEALCYADLHGLDSHGVCNLRPLYVHPMLERRINPFSVPEITSDVGAVALLDGHNGLGLVVASRAMDLAIDKARRFGVGVVAVRRSSHFGSAGYYASRALQHRMIGLAMTNLGAQAIVRPPHGIAKMLGTNPMSWAVPARSATPFLLDMSSTVVATGKLRAAQRAGQKIPEGWLADDAGKSVTDPGTYERGEGHLLWLGGSPETGGYKGYGLAVLVDVLCGVVSGAAFGPDPSASNRASPAERQVDNIGHFFLALSPEAFRPAGRVLEQMDLLLETLLGCPTYSPDQRVLYPGVKEAEERARRLRAGIPLNQYVYQGLLEIADLLGLSPLPGSTKPLDRPAREVVP